MPFYMMLSGKKKLIYLFICLFFIIFFGKNNIVAYALDTDGKPKIEMTEGELIFTTIDTKATSSIR